MNILLYFSLKGDDVHVSIYDEELRANKHRFEERKVYSLRALEPMHVGRTIILAFHPYRVKFNNNSEIIETLDDCDFIPHYNFNFV